MISAYIIYIVYTHIYIHIYNQSASTCLYLHAHRACLIFDRPQPQYRSTGGCRRGHHCSLTPAQYSPLQIDGD